MTTNQKRIDLAIDAILNDNAVEALGHLVLYKVERIEAVKNPPVEASAPERNDRLWGDDPLPPINPIKPAKFKPGNWPKFDPGKGRMRADSPSLVTCPTCKAPKGHMCIKLIGEGIGGPLMGKKRGPHMPPSPQWHDERTAAAKLKRGAV